MEFGLSAPSSGPSTKTGEGRGTGAGVGLTILLRTWLALERHFIFRVCRGVLQGGFALATVAAIFAHVAPEPGHRGVGASIVCGSFSADHGGDEGVAECALALQVDIMCTCVKVKEGRCQIRR